MFKPFMCHECGGQVLPRTNTKHAEHYRVGLLMTASDSLELPQCEGCGDVYLSPEWEKRLEADFAAQLAAKGE